MKATAQALKTEVENRLDPDPFGTFEKKYSPEMEWDWPHLRHCREVIYDAEREKRDFGKRVRLIICMPPQHGKTEQHSVRYVAYRLWKNPNLRIAVVSYDEKRAHKISRAIRRLVTDRLGFRIDPEAGQVSDWRLDGYRGGVVSRSKGQGIAGEPVDLLIADDVVGKQADGDNPQYHEDVWEWWTNDLYPRLQADGEIILVNTRWHEADLIGRLIEDKYVGKDFKVVNLPAIAELEYGEKDPIGRKNGEALCPQRYDIQALEDKRNVMGSAFDTQYQCNPFRKGGQIFPIANISILPVLPVEIRRIIRGWDKAGTEDAGCYTSGAAIGRDRHNRWVIVHVRRGQWSYAQREAVIRQQAELDRINFGSTLQLIEEEPGSGGKESAQRTVLNLSGFNVQARKAMDAKQVAWQSFAAQVQSGNVCMVAGDWNQETLDQLEKAPRGKYKDDIDAICLAFNEYALEGNGTTEPNRIDYQSESVSLAESLPL